MKSIVKGILLFIVAIILIVILTPINFCIVWKKEYFNDTALSLDKWANREFRTLWNKTLIVNNGYKFGNIEQSISEVLGHNYLLETLTPTGMRLVKILSVRHCLDAMEE